MVLLLMGCGVQKNVDLKSDQGMKIANALPVREDTGSDRSNLDILDEVLDQCLTDYDIKKVKTETGWFMSANRLRIPFMLTAR